MNRIEIKSKTDYQKPVIIRSIVLKSERFKANMTSRQCRNMPLAIPAGNSLGSCFAAVLPPAEWLVAEVTPFIGAKRAVASLTDDRGR